LPHVADFLPQAFICRKLLPAIMCLPPYLHDNVPVSILRIYVFFFFLANRWPHSPPQSIASHPFRERRDTTLSGAVGHKFTRFIPAGWHRRWETRSINLASMHSHRVARCRSEAYKIQIIFPRAIIRIFDCGTPGAGLGHERGRR
uniref:Secreted protein n=1 Tax=Heligmosomoides polygyrus TaxID=6339 RepID=A0A183G7W4_HELPZ